MAKSVRWVTEWMLQFLLTKMHKKVTVGQRSKE